MDMLGGFLSGIKPQKDGDMVDRLNSYYTTIILTVCAIFISGWSFVGQPIQCWFPAYYKGWWSEYALDYCFVQNTYFLPFTNQSVEKYFDLETSFVNIPNKIEDREDRLIGYYQWVPFVFALEAIFFYVPVLLWRNLYEATGIKVKAICDEVSDPANMDPETRRGNIQTLSRFLDYSITVYDKMHERKFRFLTGRYISTLYLCIKVIFTVNCIAQFFMLQAFLGLDSFWWGATVFSDLMAGREWPETAHFPRVTMCDYEVRVMGNIHRHTVQCVLMINMFNEKIFVFLWWWFLMLSVLTIISLIYWVVTTVVEAPGKRIIDSYLNRIESESPDIASSKRLRHDFLRNCLKPDGIFLLRIIAANSGDIVTCEMVEALWNEFKRKRAAENFAPMMQPSAPSVKLAGSEYPTLPANDRPFPPSYDQAYGLETPDNMRLRKQQAPAVTESNL